MGTRIERIKYENWGRFKAGIVPELFGVRPIELGRYLFRGQSDADWRLRSSFDRRFAGVGTVDLQELAAALLESFVESCESRQLVSFSEMPMNSIWAFAQHHGLPTRLLDWSESPYIAAFFAFVEVYTGAIESQWTSIWCLDTSSDAWGRDEGIEIIRQRPRRESRLRSQSGAFSLSYSSFDTIEAYLEEKDCSGVPLRQLILPSYESRAVLDDLELMGINFATLFPDIEGAVREAMLKVSFRLQVD